MDGFKGRLTKDGIRIHKAEDFAGMRLAGALASRILDDIGGLIRPGATTAEIDDFAFPITEELLKITDYRQTLSPLEVSKEIGQYTDGLFFDDFGSEAAIPITPFFLEHLSPELSPKSFVEALGLHPDEPKGIISRFEPANLILQRFIDKHNDELQPQARTVVELMEENLSDLTVIVLGEDNSSVYESNHPVYVVGIGFNGNLAGFDSIVIWT